MSVGFKRVGLLTGSTIFWVSGSALALTNHPIPATSDQLPHNSIVAQAVERDTNREASNTPRFSCQLMNGEYTVMYYPESDPEQAYPWATPSALGGGWTPERRCNEISRRLEFYRPDGLLEIQTTVENGYNIVCVTTERDQSCRIVLTVPPGQDAELTRDRVFENLVVADSGQDTDAVNTFVGRDTGSQLLNQVINQGLSTLGIRDNATRRSGNINLRPFLDPADGGTGTQLRRSVPTRSNPQLNPDRFR